MGISQQTLVGQAPVGQTLEKCTKCGSDFHQDRCLGCGRDSVASTKATNRDLRIYTYPLWAGFIGAMFATHYYPLVDTDRFLGFSILVFFLPIVAHFAVFSLKRLSAQVEFLRGAYTLSAAVLILLSGFLWLNGKLDKSAATPVSTTVLSKGVTRGRHSTSYYLMVPSWRPDKFDEKLQVTGGTFRSLHVGEPIVVQVHPGFFGQPWYDSVAAAPDK